MFTTIAEYRGIYSILLFLSLLFGSYQVYASKNEDMTHYQDKLEKLQKSIAKVQQHLKGSKKQRSHVVTELQTLEAEISKNARKLKTLESEVIHSRQQEKKLQNELDQLNRQLGHQRTRVIRTGSFGIQHGASAEPENAVKSTGSGPGRAGTCLF